MKRTTKEHLAALWKKTVSFVIKILNELRDRTNIIIFLIAVVIVSSPGWVTLILGFITGSKALYAISAAAWGFWAGPFTPFFPLCIAITLAARKVFDRICRRKTDIPPEKQRHIT